MYRVGNVSSPENTIFIGRSGQTDRSASNVESAVKNLLIARKCRGVGVNHVQRTPRGRLVLLQYLDTRVVYSISGSHWNSTEVHQTESLVQEVGKAV